MKDKEKVSKMINNRIFLASLIYSLIFVIVLDFGMVISNILDFGLQLKLELLWNLLTGLPFIFLLTYLFSGTQILLIGFLLRIIYKNNPNKLDNILRLRNKKSLIELIIFSLIWFILNFKFWQSFKGFG